MKIPHVLVSGIWWRTSGNVDFYKCCFL